MNNLSELVSRKANASDIDYIAYANREIEGERAKLSVDVLKRDVFSPTPKAHVVIVETPEKPIGMAFYSFTYWASDGPILWVSQMYIEPEYRGGQAVRALRDELYKQAADANAKHLMWGTHNTELRITKLWKRIGAKNLSENYSFWVKSL